MIAPVLVRWTVTLACSQDLGGGPSALGLSRHEHKVQHAVNRALRPDQVCRPDPGKHPIGREEIVALVVHRLAMVDVLVEVVVTDGNHRQRLTASPSVQEPGLFMPAFGTAAVEVIYHEQQLRPCGFQAKVGDERRPDPALNVGIC